ncbi:MAG: xanthine dehydrogenase accessory factor [Candidatus Sericytochromatia bacterium]|nr:MAG: xanthine dehydrogenase accessory factor [Candidatus Sericytochromatia bacterium]
MYDILEKQLELLKNNERFCCVTLVKSIGSTPQDQGSKMLVNENGLIIGTIGGGKVEKKSIDLAIELLKTNKKNEFVEWNLNKDIGMTCGGSVKLYFELFNNNDWNIVIFGAGHISNAIISILVNMDCKITCIDNRLEWLNKLPNSNKLKKVFLDDMPSYVKEIKENSFVLLITMGHTTDKPILLEILKTREFPYLGVIGSKAKANILKKDIEEAGLPEECKNKFYCPMGLPIGTNNITEIAISIIAQLIQIRDSV